MNCTRWELITALMTGGPLKAWLRIVNSVEREDGSNKSYNVAGYCQRAGHDESITIHVTVSD